MPTTAERECAMGEYQTSDSIHLTASPDPGWRVGGWTGTDDDTSTETTNSLTMPPADHEVTVHYVDLQRL